MKKIVDSILTFIVNDIFGGSHPGLFPLKGHSFRCAWGTPVGELFPVKLRSVLVEVGSFAAIFQVFCLLLLLLPLFYVNGYFGGTNPGACLIILNTLFILILQGRKLFWRAPLQLGF